GKSVVESGQRRLQRWVSYLALTAVVMRDRNASGREIRVVDVNTLDAGDRAVAPSNCEHQVRAAYHRASEIQPTCPDDTIDNRHCLSEPRHRDTLIRSRIDLVDRARCRTL